MLLPQSSAFETLRNRLHSVASVSVLQQIPSEKLLEQPLPSDIDFDALLEHFRSIRRRHQQYLIARTFVLHLLSLVTSNRVSSERLAEDKKSIKAAIEDSSVASKQASPRNDKLTFFGAAEGHS